MEGSTKIIQEGDTNKWRLREWGEEEFIDGWQP